MKNKVLIGSFLFIAILMFLVGVCTTNSLAKDKIIIGAARPLSGPLAFFEANAFGPIYKMWVDEVNAKGGINGHPVPEPKRNGIRVLKTGDA